MLAFSFSFFFFCSFNALRIVHCCCRFSLPPAFKEKDNDSERANSVFLLSSYALFCFIVQSPCISTLTSTVVSFNE